MAKRKQLSLETIEKWLQDSDWRVRAAAMNVCQGREIPIEVIEKGLQDSEWRVRAAAMNACQGREIPIEVIEKWLQDSDWRVRAAAMNACQGREIPIEVIEKGLQDSDWRVCAAAMNACQGRESYLSKIRTVEPPEVVYKKCMFDVIVVATIPADAITRGHIDGKCRANKAVIVDIIGDVAGEKVGISQYDERTTYFIGDAIEIEDFDLSFEECSKGFHFFCTRGEAEDY